MSESGEAAVAGGDETSSGSKTPDGPAPKPSDTSKKGRELRTLDELLVHAYELGGKRFKVPAAAINAIAGSLEDSGSAQLLDRVRTAAAEDPHLAVPPRLLVVVDGSPASTGPLRRAVVTLTAAVLRQHPAFGAPVLQEALDAPPLEVDEAFDRLIRATRNLTTESPGDSDTGPAKAARARLQANAVASFALLLAMRDQWPVGDLIDRLNQHLWHEEGRRVRRPTQRAVLVDSREPDVLGVVTTELSARQRRLAQDRDAQAEYAAEARRRVFEVEAELERAGAARDELEGELAALREEVQQLQATISEERRHRLIDRSHHVDDYERLRTRMVRTLSTYTELLDDGLHALRNGSTSVTEEFIERAVGALAKELTELKDGDGGHD